MVEATRIHMPTDKDPFDMSDRELLIECVARMRKTDEMVTSFIAAMEKNPMLRMMAGKVGM